jgi:hypothetical protein
MCEQGSPGFEVYRCHPPLRSYGDAGVALMCFSTFGAGTLAVLLAISTYARTCAMQRATLGVVHDLSTRVVSAVYLLLLPPLHVAVIFPSLLRDYVHAPQMSVDVALDYTFALWLQCALLAMGMACYHRFMAYYYLCIAVQFMAVALIVFRNRLQDAAYSYDCILPLLMMVALGAVLLYVPHALRLNDEHLLDVVSDQRHTLRTPDGNGWRIVPADRLRDTPTERAWHAITQRL